MIRGIDAITIFSENATKLAKFYTDKVGLKSTGEFVMGEGKDEANVYMFEYGKSADLGIIDHSKVKGKNKNPERFMINFEVDNIEETVSKLEKNGVKKIQEIYHVEDYGKIATFEDPDKNYFQMVQVRS